MESLPLFGGFRAAIPRNQSQLRRGLKPTQPKQSKGGNFKLTSIGEQTSGCIVGLREVHHHLERFRIQITHRIAKVRTLLRNQREILHQAVQNWNLMEKSNTIEAQKIAAALALNYQNGTIRERERKKGASVLLLHSSPFTCSVLFASKLQGKLEKDE